jgi:NADPH2:quinone reductase
MKKAIRMHSTGGPEVLQWEDVPVPDPGPGEVLLRQHAVGLNYIDVYFRTGLYKLPSLPAVIGQEGAGVVVAVGPDVTNLAVGDRVAYAGGLGAYAQYRVAHADKLVILPEHVSFEQAASVMLQGLTAHYLIFRTYQVKPGDTILVHAAAGGVGLLLCQWASHLGATVIGVVSTEEKAQLARENGAAHSIIGHQLSLLSAKGSLYVTRPTLATYTAKRADLVASAGTLLAAVESGVLRTHINQSFALADAADAHRALESRRTTGSTVLIP